MPDQKLSSLPGAGTITGSELIYLVQGGNSVQSTVSDIQGAAYTAGVGISISSNVISLASLNISQFTNNSGYITAAAVATAYLPYAGAIANASMGNFTFQADSLLAYGTHSGGVQNGVYATNFSATGASSFGLLNDDQTVGVQFTQTNTSTNYSGRLNNSGYIECTGVELGFFNIGGKGGIKFGVTATTTGAVTNYNFLAPAHTGQTASTNIHGYIFNTGSRQFANGAITLLEEIIMTGTVYSHVSGSNIIATASTLNVYAPSTTGGFTTITNNYAIVNNGNFKVTGNLDINSLTITRIPFAGTNGRLTDNVKFSIDTSLLGSLPALNIDGLKLGIDASGQAIDMSNYSIATIKHGTNSMVSNTSQGAYHFLAGSYESNFSQWAMVGAYPALYMFPTAGTVMTNSNYVLANDGNTQYINGVVNVNTQISGNTRIQTTNSATTLTNNDLILSTVGKGFQLKGGSNARAGNAVVLSGGSATVANTSVTANTLILLFVVELGTVTVAQGLSAPASLVVSGTSFTIKSASAIDTSTIGYLLIELN